MADGVGLVSGKQNLPRATHSCLCISPAFHYGMPWFLYDPGDVLKSQEVVGEYRARRWGLHVMYGRAGATWAAMELLGTHNLPCAPLPWKDFHRAEVPFQPPGFFQVFWKILSQIQKLFRQSMVNILRILMSFKVCDVATPNSPLQEFTALGRQFSLPNVGALYFSLDSWSAPK